MRRRRSLLLLVVASLAAALLPAAAFADGATDDHVRRLGEQLQCPVCPSESVANSDAELAVQMRAFIREKLAEGWTDEQILQYYVDRYGESILLSPPKWGFSSLIWLGVVVVVAIGLVVVGGTLVEIRRRGAEEVVHPLRGPGLSDDERARYAARLDRILHGDEGG